MKKLKKILVVTSFKKNKISHLFKSYKKRYHITIKNSKISEDKKYIIKKFKNFDYLISYANGMILNEKILKHYEKKRN